ncbi:hypothetical protein Mpsy_0607 [Methanolobus psychrophilus R15]|nr:hypothetical protein Mpsy_0607 [Methanolobus psychrophilus R15]
MKYDTMAETQIDEYKGRIVPILLKNGVDKAGIFGSFARNEAGLESDIDILVRFKGRKSLFDFARLKLELEKEARRKVEVITYDSIVHLSENGSLKTK